jgi:hypothetical protein
VSLFDSLSSLELITPFHIPWVVLYHHSGELKSQNLTSASPNGGLSEEVTNVNTEYHSGTISQGKNSVSEYHLHHSFLNISSLSENSQTFQLVFYRGRNTTIALRVIK